MTRESPKAMTISAESAKCVYCHTEMEVVRPGKHQPRCFCYEDMTIQHGEYVRLQRELLQARSREKALREALDEGKKLYAEIVEECYEYTLEDRPLLSVGIEEWIAKVAALASEKVND